MKISGIFACLILATLIRIGGFIVIILIIAFVCFLAEKVEEWKGRHWNSGQLWKISLISIVIGVLFLVLGLIYVEDLGVTAIVFMIIGGIGIFSFYFWMPRRRHTYMGQGY